MWKILWAGSAGRQLKLRNTLSSVVLPCAEEEARIWKLSRKRSIKTVKKKAPWINEDIKLAMVDRDKASSKLRKKHSQKIVLEYKRLKNLVTKTPNAKLRIGKKFSHMPFEQAWS
nr:unnamed protein product [Callosobruchus chinensis]